MSDVPAGTLSLEEPTAPTIETPPTSAVAADPTPPEADDDAEPAEAVEVAGRKMVPVSVLTAERRRVRETTERQVRERELTPLQQKAQDADRLRAALNEAQPYLDHLRQHPELLQPPKPTPIEEQIPDEEAAQEARDLELYAQDGTPDVARARRIIARRRTEAIHAANAAAQAAVGPITSQTAQQTSNANFMRTLASARTQDGRPLVEAKELAQFWAQLPPELTQHPQVGRLILEASVGRKVLGGGNVQPPARSPIVSEPAGGRSGPTFQHSNLTRNIAQAAGMSDKAFAEAAKNFQPNSVNVLGD